MSNPLDCVIPARRESIRDAERTESAKTGVSAARTGRAVGRTWPDRRETDRRPAWTQ
jgi:hypothetical protein